jgi:type VI protein secretion system component VasF
VTALDCKWGNILSFQGLFRAISARPAACNSRDAIRYKISTIGEIHIGAAPSNMKTDGQARRSFRERIIMKLPLIAASILAYILLVTAWICYATDPLNRLF